MKYLFLVCILSVSVHSHVDHDWRYDYEAYLKVETVPHPIVQMFSQVQEKTDDVQSNIDMTFFKAKLVTFASINRSRNDELDKARSFLAEEYKKLGFEISSQPFGSGTNFIAEKKGIKDPSKILILSSHIDSVGNKGANDNGTGTIGALTLAKYLAAKDFAYTVRILGFDREERGIIGSDAYVATITDKSKIIGNINFEMMGYHSRNDGGFHVIDCDRSDSVFLSQKIKQSIETLGLDLHIVKTCTNRSDHASFWRAKIPAIVISENFFGGDADPCYHSRCDIVDTRLNYPYMEKILETTLHTLEKLLNE